MIENPWFYGDDELSAPRERKEQIIGLIRGCPEAWTTYYPSQEGLGIFDEGQEIIIDHDPRNWNMIDYKIGKKTSLDGGAFDLVFRIVRDLFSDLSWIPSKSRRIEIDAPTQWREKRS